MIRILKLRALLYVSMAGGAAIRWLLASHERTVRLLQRFVRWVDRKYGQIVFTAEWNRRRQL
jgi:hypothetical protein